MKHGMLILTGIVLEACFSRETVANPPFNHHAHIEAKIECLQCHEGLFEAESLSLPKVGQCLDCHKDAKADHPYKTLYTELRDPEQRPWTAIARQPDHVFFSHTRHVDVAELECTTCHREMMDRVSIANHRDPMSMTACIDCHETQNAQSAAWRAVFDCVACHR